MSFAACLDHLKGGATLSEDDMAAAMRTIMEGGVAGADLESFLTILARRGETVDEITGAARVLRERAATIDAPPGAVDCCGTGGDGLGTYNISTAAALIAAACGVPVAKHGNRASSSKSGTADVLEALGVRLDVSHDTLERSLAELNFAFLMAPRHHEAMRHVMLVRKRLGFRTIFNLLGPLANPAGAKIQLLGVYDGKWLQPLAETLQKLGAQTAWIVHGRDGLDEITTTGPTDIVALADGEITLRVLQPEDFNLPLSSLNALKGGMAMDNAQALRDLLHGLPSAYRDIVIANAAAILLMSDKVESLSAGAAMAAEAIDSRMAETLLTNYITLTQSDP